MNGQKYVGDGPPEAIEAALERGGASAADAPIATHGQVDDMATLRAIASLYGEAAIDAERDWYCAPRSDPGKKIRALDRVSDLRTAANDIAGLWGLLSAHAILRPVSDHLGNLVAHRRLRMGAWARVVAEDVRLRLAGDMGRPLPASPPPDEVPQEEPCESGGIDLDLTAP